VRAAPLALMVDHEIYGEAPCQNEGVPLQRYGRSPLVTHSFLHRAPSHLVCISSGGDRR
jgi:hypothetical protein